MTYLVSSGGADEYGLVFTATDITGSVDVTAELEALLATADGDVIYIPEGIYRINDLDVAYSVNIRCAEGAIFKNDEPNSRVIYQRNEGDATLEQDILVITELRWFSSEMVARLTVTDASVYTKGDVVHIHSQDGWITGDNRRIGQSSKVAEIDTVNNYIYLNQRLELGTLMITSPRIRKYGTKTFIWRGGEFQAGGDTDDRTIGLVLGDRRSCIEVYGTPYVDIQDVKFDGIWAQGITMRSCPYSYINNIQGKNLHNMLTQDETPINITGITIANPCVITMASTVGLANGDDIVIEGVVGTTELNNRQFRVQNLTGTTIELLDYYGDGTSDVTSVGMTVYTSGGTIAVADVNALGYLIWVYAACCGTVLNNIKSEEGRHGVVTSDGIGDSSYTDAEWATYGFPHNVVVSNSFSSNAYGIPFDTHEEAVRWTFANCHVQNAGRGPEGGSYNGAGFQSRGIHTTFIGCTVTNANMGIRISIDDIPVVSKDIISGCVFRDCIGKSDGEGYGVRLLPEVTNPTNKPITYFNNVTIEHCGTGIHMDRNTEAVFGAGVMIIGCDEAMDIAAGTELKAMGRLMIDVRHTDDFNSDHYGIRMRSDATYGGSKAILLGGATIMHTAANKITALFYEADTTATKTYYCPTNGFIQDDEGGTAATLVSTGATTMNASTDITII